MAFKLGEVLCPSRHGIFAMMFKDEMEDEVINGLMRTLMAALLRKDAEIIKLLAQNMNEDVDEQGLLNFNGSCCICGAHNITWTYQARVMKEKDWDKATQALFENQRDQMIAGFIMKALGLNKKLGDN